MVQEKRVQANNVVLAVNIHLLSMYTSAQLLRRHLPNPFRELGQPLVWKEMFCNKNVLMISYSKLKIIPGQQS